MDGYTTVSVKVSRALKEKMNRLGIKPSKVLRKSIEDEVRKKEVEKIKEEISAMKDTLDKIPIEGIIKGIREDRDGR